MDVQTLGALAFDDRLPDEVEIVNAKQLTDIAAASLIKEGKKAKVSLFPSMAARPIPSRLCRPWQRPCSRC